MLRYIAVLMAACLHFTTSRFYYDNFLERKHLFLRGANPGADGCLSMTARRESTAHYNTAYYEKRMRIRPNDDKNKGNFRTTFSFKWYREESFLIDGKDELGGTGVEGGGLSFFVTSSISGRPVSNKLWTNGYDNMGSGFAVELDVFKNKEAYDPENSHVSVHWTGSQASMNNSLYTQHNSGSVPDFTQARLSAAHTAYSTSVPVALSPTLLPSVRAIAETRGVPLTVQLVRSVLEERSGNGMHADAVVVSVSYFDGLVSVFVDDEIVPKLQVVIPPLTGDFLIGFASTSVQHMVDHFRLCDWRFERRTKPFPSVLSYAMNSGLKIPAHLSAQSHNTEADASAPCDPGFMAPDCTVDATLAAKACILATPHGCTQCLSTTHDCRWCPTSNKCIPGALVRHKHAVPSRSTSNRYFPGSSNIMLIGGADVALKKKKAPVAMTKPVTDNPPEDISLCTLPELLIHTDQCLDHASSRTSPTVTVFVLAAGVSMIGYVSLNTLHQYEMAHQALYNTISVVHNSAVTGLTSVCIAFLLNKILFEVTINRVFSALLAFLFVVLGAFVVYCSVASFKRLSLEQSSISNTRSMATISSSSVLDLDLSIASETDDDNDAFLRSIAEGKGKTMWELKRNGILLGIASFVLFTTSIIAVTMDDEVLSKMSFLPRLGVYALLTMSTGFCILFVAFETGHQVTGLSKTLQAVANPPPQLVTLVSNLATVERSLPYSHTSFELLLICCASVSAGTFFGLTFANLDLADTSRNHLDQVLQREDMITYPVSLMTGLTTGFISKYRDIKSRGLHIFGADYSNSVNTNNTVMHKQDDDL